MMNDCSDINQLLFELQFATIEGCVIIYYPQALFYEIYIYHKLSLKLYFKRQDEHRHYPKEHSQNQQYQ